MAIPYYEELEGSPTFHFGPGEGASERKFWLPDWGNLQSFVSMFMNINFRLTTTNPIIQSNIQFMLDAGSLNVAMLDELETTLFFDVYQMLVNYDSSTFPDKIAAHTAAFNGEVTIRTMIQAIANAGRAAFFIERASMPGYPILLVNDIKIEPMVGDAIVYGTSPCYYYRGAKVTIGYKSDSPNSFQHKLKHAVDVITYPGSNLVWNRDAKPAGTDIHGGVLSPHMEHDLSWRYVLTIPWAAIRNCLGKVNDREFLGVPAECLLFMGAETEIEYVAGLSLGYKMSYKMSEKNNGTIGSPKGWNHFLRPDANPPAFERLDIRGGNYIYQLAEFEPLFSAEVPAVEE